ncbi:hypothetical protein [Paraburkholderia caballeronis]|uniref:hypothetical protein n=1 Tax=Paraburkholderia caballeronis TaxID=416943 RepID=UPI001FCBC957|nr:hypothetical protein [Paraburkholderia caballeronis]
MTDSNISNQEAPAELYAQTADAMYAYMDDCNFDETHLTGTLIWLALEYAYHPHSRFWRDFDTTTIFDAVSRRFPNWRAMLGKAGRSADALLREFEEAVRRNAFDEANAEMLMALPISERPTTSHTAFDWIVAALAEKGLTAELEYAERNGYDCGTDALLVLHRLEHAQRGIVVDRIGRFVALYYRHAAMNG